MTFARAQGIALCSVIALWGSSAVAQDVGTKAALNTPRLQLFQGDGTNFVLVDDLYYEIGMYRKVVRLGDTRIKSV